MVFIRPRFAYVHLLSQNIVFGLSQARVFTRYSIIWQMIGVGCCHNGLMVNNGL